MSGVRQLRCLCVWVGAGVLILGCAAGHGQRAAARYKAAESVLKKHVPEYDFLNDDSDEARAALKQMWSATGEAVIEILEKDPKAPVQEIDAELCRLQSAAGECDAQFGVGHTVLALGKDLFAVVAVPVADAASTVLVIGKRGGRWAQLWSLAEAKAGREHDPQDLIGAWRVERTGEACREKNSQHKPGSCGPLYADLGLLPVDGEGRPRFYVDAGYSQTMGATVEKQTSIWRWDGDHAELVWIDCYDYMIDQATGTSFDDDKGVLHVGQKGEFKTMYSCGSCIDRPLDQMVLLTKTGVEELGVRSLAPELDQIDALFSRMQEGKPTAGIASAQVVRFLTGEIGEAKKGSKEMVADSFSTGMIDGTRVRLTAAGAEVCLAADEIGALEFTLRRTRDGGYFIERVAEAKGGECERGEYLPATQEAVPAKQ